MPPAPSVVVRLDARDGDDASEVVSVRVSEVDELEVPESVTPPDAEDQAEFSPCVVMATWYRVAESVPELEPPWVSVIEETTPSAPTDRTSVEDSLDVEDVMSCPDAVVEPPDVRVEVVATPPSVPVVVSVPELLSLLAVMSVPVSLLEPEEPSVSPPLVTIPAENASPEVSDSVVVSVPEPEVVSVVESVS